VSLLSFFICDCLSLSPILVIILSSFYSVLSYDRVRGGLFNLALKVLKDGFGLSKKDAKDSKDHLQPSNGK
jgi:hypothetical protein